jgi:hypothetical protein
MIENMFTWYLKERLQEANTPTHVNNPPKKHTTRDKIKPLSYQRVGLENEQHGVIRLGYLIVPSRTRKC